MFNAWISALTSDLQGSKVFFNFYHFHPIIHSSILPFLHSSILPFLLKYMSNQFLYLQFLKFHHRNRQKSPQDLIILSINHVIPYLWYDYWVEDSIIFNPNSLYYSNMSPILDIFKLDSRNIPGFIFVPFYTWVQFTTCQSCEKTYISILVTEYGLSWG